MRLVMGNWNQPTVGMWTRLYCPTTPINFSSRYSRSVWSGSRRGQPLCSNVWLREEQTDQLGCHQLIIPSVLYNHFFLACLKSFRKNDPTVVLALSMNHCHRQHGVFQYYYFSEYNDSDGFLWLNFSIFKDILNDGTKKLERLPKLFLIYVLGDEIANHFKWLEALNNPSRFHNLRIFIHVGSAPVMKLRTNLLEKFYAVLLGKMMSHFHPWIPEIMQVGHEIHSKVNVAFWSDKPMKTFEGRLFPDSGTKSVKLSSFRFLEHSWHWKLFLYMGGNAFSKILRSKRLQNQANTEWIKARLVAGAGPWEIIMKHCFSATIWAN